MLKRVLSETPLTVTCEDGEQSVGHSGVHSAAGFLASQSMSLLISF